MNGHRSDALALMACGKPFNGIRFSIKKGMEKQVDAWTEARLATGLIWNVKKVACDDGSQRETLSCTICWEGVD